jgi:hypothetical protein
VPIVAPLVELGVLALVLWAVATALAIALLMRYIGDVFRPIPVVGGYIAGAVNSVAQAISYAAGKLEHGIDKLIGASWHLLARYMDQLWHQIEAQAGTLVHVAELVARLVHAHALLRAIVHPLTKAWHGIEHGVRDLRREAHQIKHRVQTLEREIAKGIGHDLRIHVKALERELNGIKHRVIPDLRQRIKAAEGEVADLRNFVKAIPGTRYLEWAAAVVAAGLGVGVLNFFRCPTFRNKTLPRGCGFWDDLESLLGLAVVVLAVEDFETLVREMQAVEGEVIGAAKDLFNIG